MRKVPEKFTNTTASHLCVDPQIQWTLRDKKFSTVHNHSQVFKPVHGSGPDALAQEIINNVTGSYYSLASMYLEDPISAGYEGCPDIRFDWEQDGQLHNLSKVHGGTGTNLTKQWSSINDTDGITKLSMACTMMLEHKEGLELTQKDNAEKALLSSQWRLQVLFALLASFIVSCA